MGCVQSVEREEDTEAKIRNDEIEKQLVKDSIAQKNTFKILVLEAENSGKTEILQRMKMVHDGGFSEQERIRYRRHIAGNAVKCMRSFLEIVRNLDLTLSHRSERYVGVILAESDYMPDEDEDADPSSTVLHALRTLRRDPVIEVLLQRSSELLDDSIPFYLSFIDRLATPNYLPTDEEIIAVRMRTPMFETSFRAGEVTYRVVDFSVQRSDRRKWIHCFEGVEAVLFFASLNGYDEMLSEGNTNINRLEEAMALFGSICNSKWFTKTALILLLTKSDHFAEKLVTSPLKKYFPDYRGGSDRDSACDFILQRFMALNKSKTKQIYAHYTSEKDVQQVKFVMSTMQDIIATNNRKSIAAV